jgi:hypothetical protein
MKNKIGVAVITCNRQDFCENCLDSMPEVDTLIVVNDGNPYDLNIISPKKVKEVIQHTTNKSVCISKNDALRYLIQDGCELLYLCEDDQIIKRQDIFEQYIKTAEVSGIWKMQAALHGPANRDQNYQPKPRKIIEYPGDIKLALYPNCVGSFEFFHKTIIKNCGYYDSYYNQNCWEHCDYCRTLEKNNVFTPWWWFPDIYESDKYIEEQAGTENSVIRKSDEWKQKLAEHAHYFKYKHGYFPTTIPDTPEEKVVEILKMLKKNYARKIL